MKAVIVAVAVVCCLALAANAQPLPTLPKYFSANLTETRTFQNQTRKNNAFRWNCNDHKQDRVDSDSGRGAITFLTRLDVAVPQICNIFTQGGQQQCRCRRATGNTTTDAWFFVAGAKAAGTGACPFGSGNCNKFVNDNPSVFGAPHTLYVLASDNATPVQHESGAADRRVVTQYVKFDKAHPDDKVFAIPSFCQPPPM